MIDLHKLLTEADRVLRIAEAHALKSGLSMLKPGLGRQPHEHPGNDFALPHETRTFAWTFSDPLPQPHRPEVAGGDSSARKLLDDIGAALAELEPQVARAVWRACAEYSQHADADHVERTESDEPRGAHRPADTAARRSAGVVWRGVAVAVDILSGARIVDACTSA